MTLSAKEIAEKWKAEFANKKDKLISESMVQRIARFQSKTHQGPQGKMAKKIPMVSEDADNAFFHARVRRTAEQYRKDRIRNKDKESEEKPEEKKVEPPVIPDQSSKVPSPPVVVNETTTSTPVSEDAGSRSFHKPIFSHRTTTEIMDGDSGLYSRSLQTLNAQGHDGIYDFIEATSQFKPKPGQFGFSADQYHLVARIEKTGAVPEVVYIDPYDLYSKPSDDLPVKTVPGSSGASGSGLEWARDDHDHPMDEITSADVGIPNGEHIGDMLYWDGSKWALLSVPADAAVLAFDQIDGLHWAIVDTTYKVVQRNTSGSIVGDWTRAHA